MRERERETETERETESCRMQFRHNRTVLIRLDIKITHFKRANAAVLKILHIFLTTWQML